MVFPALQSKYLRKFLCCLWSESVNKKKMFMMIIVGFSLVLVVVRCEKCFPL